MSTTASATAPAMPAPVAAAGAASVMPVPAVPAMAIATVESAASGDPAAAPTVQAAAQDQTAQAVANTAAPAEVAKQFTVPGRPATATTAQVGAPIGAPASSSGAGSIGGAVLALVLVVGLILVLGWLAKRMPGIGGASNPALKVVGSLSLSPRERVVVVAIGQTQLVLGTGAGGTRVLHQLDTPLPVPQQKAPPAFAQVLAQHFGKKQ